jgi:hypothetical protein
MEFDKIGPRKFESGSDLFVPENFADTDLTSGDWLRKLLPLMAGQFDEEDAILAFSCDTCKKVHFFFLLRKVQP